MGELVEREFILMSLIESLEWAAEAVERGEPLSDWDYIFIVDFPDFELGRFVRGKVTDRPIYKCLFEPCLGPTMPHMELDTVLARLTVEKCMAFMRAHTLAQERMKSEFCDNIDLKTAEETILAESESMVAKAEEHILGFPEEELKLIMSHKMSKILLNQGANFIEEITTNGLLKEQEAGPFIQEIDECLKHVDYCTMKKHPGEKEVEKEDPSEIVVEA